MAGSTEKLRKITTFESLVNYLRDDMGWPIEAESFDDIIFEFTPKELGIDDDSAAKIDSIKRMRPLTTDQPWGVFFVEFEPKKLPVTALRRILKEVVTAKRASASKAERVTWDMEDLLFISAMGGDGSERAMNFAHFSQGGEGRLPSLKVVAWDSDDTPLHMEDVSEKLTEKLAWPDNEEDTAAWRKAWSSAFTLHHGQVIETSKKLAALLAALARDIRKRILDSLALEDGEGPLTDLMKTFRETLIHDLDEDDFADMYAQTIAYGLLSARIIGQDESTDDHGLSLPLTSPFLRELMEEFLRVGRSETDAGGAGIDFDEIGVGEIVDLLDNTDMEAVVRDFGDKNPLEDPVIHFYEAFLKEYDAELKTQRGVFYTPRPVVSFIVRSVDEILRTEFGLTDGLADTTTWGGMAERFDDLEIPAGVEFDETFVRILDPATGTGTFLVEAIDVIHTTLTDRWASSGKNATEIADLWNEYVPAHLLPRLHGYELLMAPYAIAHLKVGLKLLETGYRFDSDERVHIYLTNALEPPTEEADSQFELAVPALAAEAEAVNRIKSSDHFTVVTGNPPYSLMSANLGTTQRALVDPYRFVDGHRIVERGALQFEKNIQDDYVKFWRFAQMTIDRAGTGIVGLITNHTYLTNPTLRGLRRSLMHSFNQAIFTDLHGNSKRREQAPDGRTDENVFDIQQGVAITVAARIPSPSVERYLLRDIWGSRKAKYLELAQTTAHTGQSIDITPRPPRFEFLVVDHVLLDEWESWFQLDEIFENLSTGIATARDNLTVGFTQEQVERRLDLLTSLPIEDARRRLGIGPDTKDWQIKRAIRDIVDSGTQPGGIAPYSYRPFDQRFTYYTGNPRGFLCNPRWPVMQHMLQPNIGLCCSKSVETGDGYAHVLAVSGLVDHHCVSMKEVNYVLPLITYSAPAQRGQGLFDNLQITDDQRHFNLSEVFLKSFSTVANLDSRTLDEATALSLFGFIYGVLSASSYRSRYASPLRRGFARIPLPRTSTLFESVSTRGLALVRIHAQSNLTALKDTGASLHSASHRLQEIGDFEGPIESVRFENGSIWLDKRKTRGFQSVPEEIWDFRIGNYRVVEKWLQSRKGRGGKNPRLAQSVTRSDLAYLGSLVARIESTLEISADIDRIIADAGGFPDAFAPSR